eukprot:g43418.t1
MEFQRFLRVALFESQNSCLYKGVGVGYPRMEESKRKPARGGPRNFRRGFRRQNPAPSAYSAGSAAGAPDHDGEVGHLNGNGGSGGSSGTSHPRRRSRHAQQPPKQAGDQLSLEGEVEASGMTQDQLLDFILGPREWDSDDKHKDESDEDDHGQHNTHCLLCARKLRHVVLTDCVHSGDMCALCVVRLRLLDKKAEGRHQCPFCKKDWPRVIVTDVQSPAKFQDLCITSLLYDKSTDLHFLDSDLMHKYCEFVSLSCALCQPRGKSRRQFDSMTALSKHLEHSHQRYYCSACVETLRLFPPERDLFTRTQLRKHFMEGSPAHDRMGPIEAHPFCEFCNVPYFSSDELYAHLTDPTSGHRSCHFCSQSGQMHRFFLNANQQAQHFLADHHVCQHPDCLALFPALEVFANAIDLNAHNLRRHSDNMTRAEKKKASRIDLAMFQEEKKTGRSRGPAGYELALAADLPDQPNNVDGNEPPAPAGPPSQQQQPATRGKNRQRGGGGGVRGAGQPMSALEQRARDANLEMLTQRKLDQKEQKNKTQQLKNRPQQNNDNNGGQAGGMSVASPVLGVADKLDVSLQAALAMSTAQQQHDSSEEQFPSLPGAQPPTPNLAAAAATISSSSAYPTRNKIRGQDFPELASTGAMPAAPASWGGRPARNDSLSALASFGHSVKTKPMDKRTARRLKKQQQEALLAESERSAQLAASKRPAVLPAPAAPAVPVRQPSPAPPPQQALRAPSPALPQPPLRAPSPAAVAPSAAPSSAPSSASSSAKWSALAAPPPATAASAARPRKQDKQQQPPQQQDQSSLGYLPLPAACPPNELRARNKRVVDALRQLAASPGQADAFVRMSGELQTQQTDPAAYWQSFLALGPAILQSGAPGSPLAAVAACTFRDLLSLLPEAGLRQRLHHQYATYSLAATLSPALATQRATAQQPNGEHTAAADSQPAAAKPKEKKKKQKDKEKEKKKKKKPTPAAVEAAAAPPSSSSSSSSSSTTTTTTSTSSSSSSVAGSAMPASQPPLFTLVPARSAARSPAPAATGPPQELWPSLAQQHYHSNSNNSTTDNVASSRLNGWAMAIKSAPQSEQAALSFLCCFAQASLSEMQERGQSPEAGGALSAMRLRGIQQTAEWQGMDMSAAFGSKATASLGFSRNSQQLLDGVAGAFAKSGLDAAQTWMLSCLTQLADLELCSLFHYLSALLAAILPAGPSSLAAVAPAELWTLDHKMAQLRTLDQKNAPARQQERVLVALERQPASAAVGVAGLGVGGNKKKNKNKGKKVPLSMLGFAPPPCPDGVERVTMK